MFPCDTCLVKRAASSSILSTVICVVFVRGGRGGEGKGAGRKLSLLHVKFQTKSRMKVSRAVA